jgi:fructose-bisphosphate aldolase class II
MESQLGNPEGPDMPNKRYYDPRAWLRKGEESFKARLVTAFEELQNVDTLR